MSLYDATQLQRRMERQIRRYKREYLGIKEVGQDTTEASVKLRTWREREKDFLRQTGLMQQRDREQVVGFGRSEAGKATLIARRHLWDQEFDAKYKVQDESELVKNRENAYGIDVKLNTYALNKNHETLPNLYLVSDFSSSLWYYMSV